MVTDRAALEHMYLALLEEHQAASLVEQEQRKLLAGVTHLSANSHRRQIVEQQYRDSYMEVVLSNGRITDFLKAHPDFVVPQTKRKA